MYCRCYLLPLFHHNQCVWVKATIKSAEFQVEIEGNFQYNSTNESCSLSCGIISLTKMSY